MRVIILEDDPLVALDLRLAVEACGHQVIATAETLADMRRELACRPDFALLDIDLPDGKSFDLASGLERNRVPFAFVSGSRHGDLPIHLQAAPFVAKPFAHAAIRSALEAGPRPPR